MFFRVLATMSLIFLVSCSQNATQSPSTVQDEQYLGWKYNTYSDRVHQSETYVASIEGDRPTGPLGGIILGIQTDKSLGTRVWIKNLPSLPFCFPSCIIEFRTNNTTDIWTAQAGTSGDILIIKNPDQAVKTIKASSYLVVSLPFSQDNQPLFKVNGLKWPHDPSAKDWKSLS